MLYLKMCNKTMSETNNQPDEAARALAEDHLEVDRLIKKVLAALDEENTTQSFELLDLLWARLAVHIRAEHLSLFPSILNTPTVNFTGSGDRPQYEAARTAIDQLRHDHDFFMRELGIAVNTLRQLRTCCDQDVISKQLRDVRRSVVNVQSRLSEHNQLEENYVYRWVDVLLGESERLAVTSRIRHELENIPPRFKV